MSLKINMNYLKFFILLGIFFIPLNSHAQENPKVEIIQGPFKTDLFPKGEIYFQKTNNINKPVNFILKYKKNEKIIKNTIDQYEVNGGDPEIVSVFFDKIYNKKHIFIIIKWRDYHQALKMNGYDYQIYAYSINKLGKLALNQQVSNDPNLSGSDGDYDVKDIVFKYKTAADVKRYLKYKYH